MQTPLISKSVNPLLLHIALIIALFCLLGNPHSWSLAAHAKPLTLATADTTIVYISEDARSLRLIQPDGSDDRLLWQVPDNIPGDPLDSVMWRPDAQQIAFTSSHEATCSEYGADIFLINPDGSNLQRLTNGPACEQLTAYPQGSATVQISNQNSNFSEYLVYIEGAPMAKVVTVAAGSTALVAFPQVADLGEGVLQLAVATNGTTRWFDASVAVDVTPNENAHAGTLAIAGGGFAAYGATHVSWSPDGSRLAYQLGQGRLWQVGIEAAPLSEGGPLLAAQINNSVFGTYPVWSPVGNEVLYQRLNGSRFVLTRAQVDGDNAGQDLANVTDTSGIAWLSDGSGMLVSAYSDLLLTHVDLYRMTFADNNIVQVTQTTGQQAAFLPSVSPDSSQIVYGYTEDAQAKPFNAALRIMNMDGSEDHLLVENARRASWSRVAPQNPPATPTPTMQPTVQPTMQPTVQPTTQPTATSTINPTPTSQPTPSTTPDVGSVSGYKTFLPAVSR